MTRIDEVRRELAIEWHQLQAAIQVSRATWKDDVERAFSARFVAPWEAEFPALLSALERAERELEHAQRAL